MSKYNVNQIDDYMNRLTEQQANDLINHCNTFDVFPDICAWYDDMEDFYQDWVYDHDICANKEEANERYRYGVEIGEFKKFNNGEIVRLVI